MSAVLKLLIICMCMNVVMSIVGVNVGSADIIAQYASISPNGTITPSNQFSLFGNSSLPTSVESGGVGSSFSSASTGTLSFNFIDPLKLTFKTLLIVLVSLFLPIYWGFALALPLWFTMILLIQTITGVIAIVLALRGVPT